MLEKMTHFSVAQDAKFALVVVFLVSNVLPIVSVETMKCYGDICNRGTEDQFCSDHFEMCRDCADIVLDCGTKNQPLECTKYCVSFKIALELQRERNLTCTLSQTIANGFVSSHPNASSRRVTINTTVTFSCKEGFTLNGMRAKTCLGNDVWTEERDPFCLSNTYIFWQRSGIPLVALSTSLFVVIVILMSVLLRQLTQRRINAQPIVSPTSLTMRCSSVEIGIDSFAQDESCALICNKNSTQNQNIDIEAKTDKTAEIPTCEDSKQSSATDFSSEPSIDLNPDRSQCLHSNSVVNTVNLSLNLGGSIAQHQTDHSNNTEENNTKKTERKANKKQPQEEHTADQTPIEESQESVEALQETQEESKGTKPFLQSDKDFALNEPTLPGCNDRAFASNGSRAKHPHCPIT